MMKKLFVYLLLIAAAMVPAQNIVKNSDFNADEKKYSDADLDKIINQKFAKWQKDQEKAVDEAKKLATMTEQEKAEHERDEIKKELEALKKANNMAEMGKQARKLLSEAIENKKTYTSDLRDSSKL